MIEVAKVVTLREREYQSSGWTPSMFGDSSYCLPDPRYRDVEWITVMMDEHGIELTVTEVKKNGSPLRSEAQKIVINNPNKVIELAQVLMKAAESQQAYATAAKALAEQKMKLDDTFKDRISGLGLKQPDKAAMLRVVSGDEVIEA